MTELPPHIPDTMSYKTPPVLLPYQQRQVADASSLKVIKKSRRIGITWAETSDNVLTTASSTPADRVNVYYIAHSQDMTIEYIQACTMWAQAFNYAASGIEEGFWEKDDDDRYIRTYTIESPGSGFHIVVLPSHPFNLRGRRDIIVIDEATSHKQLGGLLRTTLTILIWGGKVRVISTHDGNDNPFNTLIGDIRTGRQGGDVRHIIFRGAVSKGLFRRVYLYTRKE